MKKTVYMILVTSIVMMGVVQAGGYSFNPCYYQDKCINRWMRHGGYTTIENNINFPESTNTYVGGGGGMSTLALERYMFGNENDFFRNKGVYDDYLQEQLKPLKDHIKKLQDQMAMRQYYELQNEKRLRYCEAILATK